MEKVQLSRLVALDKHFYKLQRQVAVRCRLNGDEGQRCCRYIVEYSEDAVHNERVIFCLLCDKRKMLSDRVILHVEHAKRGLNVYLRSKAY